jgi:hypothetical protein
MSNRNFQEKFRKEEWEERVKARVLMKIERGLFLINTHSPPLLSVGIHQQQSIPER